MSACINQNLEVQSFKPKDIIILQEMWQYLLAQYAKACEQYAAAKSALGPLRLTKWEIMGLLLRKTWHDVALLQSDLRQDWQTLSIAKRTFIFGAAILAIAAALDTITSRFLSLSRRLGIPVLRPPPGVHRWDYAVLLREGARRYPRTPYILSYSGYEYIVYPASAFDEVKRLSPASASAIEWFTHVYFQGWRFLGRDNSALHKTIAVDLARAVPSRVPARQRHCADAVERAIGSCDEWTAVPLAGTLLELVARTNAPALVGPALGSDERWITAVQRLPMAIMIAVFVAHAVPRWLRPIVSLVVFLPAWSLYLYMMMLLRPVARQDLQLVDELGEEKKKERDDEKARFPLSTWLTARYQPSERTLSQLTHDHIVTAFESTASTAGTLYFILAELVTRPELVEELRAELAAIEDKDGHLPQTSLTELRKMDSVMRESSRVNIFSHLTLFRRVLAPVNMSVGPSLPPGALICVDAYKLTRDPERWGSDVDSFDPNRFLKLRAQPGQEGLHQFTSLGPDAPGWGDGLQACPGRTFAGNTIKIILAHLLTHYDIKLPPGAGKPQRRSMPNGSMSPDMKAKIMFRRRKH